MPVENLYSHECIMMVDNMQDGGMHLKISVCTNDYHFISIKHRDYMNSTNYICRQAFRIDGYNYELY